MSNDQSLTEQLFLRLIDQIKDSDDQTIKALNNLSDTIRQLIINVGKTPDEILEYVKKHNDIIQNQSRDIEQVLVQLSQLIKGCDAKLSTLCKGNVCPPMLDNIQTRLGNLDKDVDDINARTLTTNTFLNKIYKNISGIKKHFYWFYAICIISYGIAILIISLIAAGKISIP